MGEKISTLFPITFNPSLIVETRPERLSSDGGTIILREIDQRLQITHNLAKNLHDPRDPNTTIHPLIELLRTRLYLIIQGWKDADDADIPFLFMPLPVLHLKPELIAIMCGDEGEKWGWL